jgi:protein-tyrosine-phosphatase
LTLRILFVCHANTSRSIMAETLLRRMIEEQGLADRLDVDSAGVAAYARDGALVSLDTRFALRDHGIHVGEELTSTALARNLHLLEGADLVLAMTEEQRAMVARWPEARGKRITTLGEYSGVSGDIADPATKDGTVFEETCRRIRACLEQAIPRLVADADAAVR